MTTIERVCGLCPRCGHNLEREEPRRFGPLGYDPRGAVSWQERPIRLTAHEHIVFGSLVHAAGAIVPRSALEERAGFEGLSDVMDVFVCRIRKKLRLEGAPANVIETVMRRGYRLNPELLEALPC